MKRIVSLLLCLAAFSTVVLANNPKDKEEWREKVRAEKVAFLSTELDLTVEEAQAFWPVYNEMEALRRERFFAMADAFKKLQDGLQNGGDVDALLAAYLSAKEASDRIGTEMLPRIRQVLSAEKTARLYLAEEKFRHEQIQRLGAKPGPKAQ